MHLDGRPDVRISASNLKPTRAPTSCLLRPGHPEAAEVQVGLSATARRALQGFAISLRRLALPTLQALQNVGQSVHLLVDSTGLKLFGKGEWKVRRHGYSRRRSWCKVKDASTGHACAPRMTHRDVDDANLLLSCWRKSGQRQKLKCSEVMASTSIQNAEVAVRLRMINRMRVFARPKSVQVV